MAESYWNNHRKAINTRFDSSKYTSQGALDAIESFGGAPRNSSEQAWLDYIEDYYSRAEQYKGTPYYDQLMANPYLQWQDMDGMDPSAFQAAVNDRMNAGRDILYDITSSITENRYNSSVAQVARDRAAGINDTISGQIAGDTPAAATGRDEARPVSGVDEQTQLAKRQASIQNVLSVAQGFLSLGSTIGGLYSLGVGVAGQKLANQGQSIANASAGLQLSDQKQKSVLDAAKRVIPSLENFHPEDVVNNFPWSSFTPEQQAELRPLVEQPGFLYDENGNPSLELQNAFASGLKGSATGIRDAAAATSQTGHAFSGGAAFIDYYKNFGQSEIARCHAVTQRSILDVELAEYQKVTEQLNQARMAQETRLTAAQAEGQEIQNAYDVVVKDPEVARLEKKAEEQRLKTLEQFEKYNESTVHYKSLFQDLYGKFIDRGLSGETSVIRSVGSAMTLDLLTGPYIDFLRGETKYSEVPQILFRGSNDSAISFLNTVSGKRNGTLLE